MLAVPLHGKDVAPRFCSADRFLIADPGGRGIRTVRQLTIPEAAWSRRLERLAAADVSVLLCGGFNRSFLPLAEALGIQVIAGLAGEAEQLIEAFLHDEIERYRFLPGRGRRRGCRGAGRLRQGQWDEPERTPGRKGVEACRDTTEPVRWEPDRTGERDWAIATERRTERDSRRTPAATEARGGRAEPGAAVAASGAVEAASERTSESAAEPPRTPGEAMSRRAEGKLSSGDESES